VVDVADNDMLPRNGHIQETRQMQRGFSRRNLIVPWCRATNVEYVHGHYSILSSGSGKLHFCGAIQPSPLTANRSAQEKTVIQAA
jgi:hypothetical protein